MIKSHAKQPAMDIIMKSQRPPQLATSKTGIVNGNGSPIADNKPAMVSSGEAILNAGAARAFEKLMGISINEFNAAHAPKGAETKVIDGVIHAAAGDLIGKKYNPPQLSQPVSDVLQSPAKIPSIEAAQQQQSTDRNILNSQATAFNNKANSSALANNVIAPIAKGSVSLMRGIGDAANAVPEQKTINPLGFDVTSKAREGIGNAIGGTVDFIKNNSTPALISKALSPTAKTETPPTVNLAELNAAPTFKKVTEQPTIENKLENKFDINPVVNERKGLPSGVKKSFKGDGILYSDGAQQDNSSKSANNHIGDERSNTGVASNATPQLSRVHQPFKEGMASLPRDVTQSATGGSTPQERYAIQQAQLQQQAAPQLQQVQMQQQAPEILPPELIQMQPTTGMASALVNKYAAKQNDAAISAYNAQTGAQQKANDSVQGANEFGQKLAMEERQAKQRASNDAWARMLQADEFNYGRQKDQRAIEVASATAAQAQKNWETEDADKNLVYTAGKSKINPDTGEYETTTAQVFNKKTGEFIPDLNQHVATQKANYDKAMSIVNDPNAKPEIKAQYQQWLSQFKKQG